jgi:hypothetical protein
MKRLLCRCFALAALTSTSALAVPPPGHPSPAQAADLLLPDKPPAPAELPNQGKVISSVDANEFTYIEVERDGSIEWLAAPLMPIKAGSTIRYEEGVVMTDFYSKLLKRSFPRVSFVAHVVVVAAP